MITVEARCQRCGEISTSGTYYSKRYRVVLSQHQADWLGGGSDFSAAALILICNYCLIAETGVQLGETGGKLDLFLR